MSAPWTRHIPNFLSLSRIALAFVFPFMPARYHLAIVLYALFSEFMDGFLARRLNAVTRLGQMLDPIADKLFVLATAIVLIGGGKLSILQFILLAARDFVVAIGSFSVFAQEKGHSIEELRPRISGKLATASQFAWLVAAFANWPFADRLLQITIALSIASAIDYLYAVLHRRFDRSGREA